MPFINNLGEIFEGKQVPPSFMPLSANDAARFSELYQQYDKTLRDLRNRHQGQEVHIFGTGPSLNEAAKLDWSNKITIGVNGAPQTIPSLQYWLMCDDFLSPTNDSKLHRWVRDWIKSPTLPFTLIRRGVVRQTSGWLPNVMFRHSAFGPVSDPALGLFWGNSSVQAAIDLARHMGAASIHLWGVDYSGGHSYDKGDQFFSAELKKITAQFKRVGEGLEIFNRNPDSKLTCFPFLAPPAVPVVVKPQNSVFIDIDARMVEFFNNDTLTVRGFDELSKEQKKAIKVLTSKI